jgi:hypothetical protein
MNWIAPNHLVLALTIGLSVIPASITVSVVYVIARKLTGQSKYGLIASLVLLGAAIPLSQATILEEYAIASMFVALAFYFYISDRKKLTVLMLALGSAVHVIVIIISALWLIANISEVKSWFKHFWIYILFGLVPYSLVLILMYLDSPRFLAGHLSLSGINNYLGSSGTIGALSIWDTPQRLLQFVEVVSISLGLAILPLILSFKGIWKQKYYLVAIVTILFTLWLYLTDNDPSTWTFLNFSFPLIAVLVAIGVSKMQAVHYRTVAYGALGLICLNGAFLNANVLTNHYPLATEYEQSLESLPDGSYVVCASGGEYGLANYYVMAQGKKITPIFYSADAPSVAAMVSMVAQNNKGLKEGEILKLAVEKYDSALTSPRYVDYMKWAGLTEKETTKQVSILLAQGKNVFIATPTITPYWENVFKTEPLNKYVARIVGVNIGY